MRTAARACVRAGAFPFYFFCCRRIRIFFSSEGGPPASSRTGKEAAVCSRPPEREEELMHFLCCLKIHLPYIAVGGISIFLKKNGDGQPFFLRLML
jgi:hypothetical protein